MSDAQDELIRERAYAIWQAEGCPHGRDDQHWRQAAAELTQAQDEAAKRDEPVLSAPEIVSVAPATTAPDDAPAPLAAAPGPVRRGRKAAETVPAAAKGRRKKGD